MAAYERFLLGIEHYWGMQEKRLSPTHLWQVVRNLSEPEAAEVGKRTAGTRLEWLYLTLREMETYREADLKAEYARRFPGKDPRLLRVYKRQLWDILEEVLGNLQPFLSAEIRIWRRFWSSVTLWQRNQPAIAQTLWWQAFTEAVEKGWYEVALWGVFLLENYLRDPHPFAPAASLGQWTHRLLVLLSQRYEALERKLLAAERYVETRSPKGWQLPPLPEQDNWAQYLHAYAETLTAAQESHFLPALTHTLAALRSLEEARRQPHLPPYLHFHRALQWTNIGVLLLNLRSWTWYDQWYTAWEARWQQGDFLLTERTHQLHTIGLALQLGYLVQHLRWTAAYTLWQKYRSEFERHVFSSQENIGFRLGTACGIYLVLLLNRAKELHDWRRSVQKWIEVEKICDRERLWWAFLEWYEVYRDADRIAMRYTFRQLRKLWRQRFSDDERWRPILRLLAALQSHLPGQKKRLLRLLYRRWQASPTEKTYWENDSSIFPMLAFVESLRRGAALEALPPPLPQSTPLPPPLEQQLHDLLYSGTSS